MVGSFWDTGQIEDVIWDYPILGFTNLRKRQLNEHIIIINSSASNIDDYKSHIIKLKICEK